MPGGSRPFTTPEKDPRIYIRHFHQILRKEYVERRNAGSFHSFCGRAYRTVPVERKISWQSDQVTICGGVVESGCQTATV